MKLINKFIELLQVPENHENPEGLVYLRIRKLGLGIECYRCLGSGIYGNYGTCFKCGGSGFGKFRLTKALYDEVEKAVKAGELELYLERVKLEQTLGINTRKLEQQIYKCEIARDYSKVFKAERAGKVKIPSILYDLQTENNQIAKDYNDLKRKYMLMMSKPKVFKETPEDERNLIFHKLQYFEAWIAKSEILNEKWAELKEAFGAGIFEGEE